MARLSSSCLFAACLFVLSVVCTMSVHAQYTLWEPESGVDQRREHFFDKRSLSLTGDGEGHALVLWQDCYRNEVADIRAQLVDVNEEMLWGELGRFVATDDVNQLHPSAAYVGNGEWIVAYSHGFDTAFETEIRAQKINLEGQLVWNDPVVICDAENLQFFPQVVADSEGGVFVSWRDWRAGQYGDGNGEQTIYCQRIDNDGAVLWENNGIAVFSNGEVLGSLGEMRYQLISDELGGINIYDANPDASTRLQRVDGNGNTVWGSGVGVGLFTDFCADGTGGLVATRSVSHYMEDYNELLVVQADGTYNPDLITFENELTSKIIFCQDEDEYIIVFNMQINN